ncbi:hypothetical protein YC2023_021842 [Brassica napus]
MEVDSRSERSIQYDAMEILLTLESKWQPHKPLQLANDEDTRGLKLASGGFTSLYRIQESSCAITMAKRFTTQLFVSIFVISICSVAKGLSGYTTDQSLRQLFSPFGQIKEARLIKDSQTQRPKGFGFVTFESEDDAQKAMKALDGKIVDGRLIFVEAAKDVEAPTTKLDENTHSHYKTS